MPGWLDLRCVEGAGCPKDDGMPLSSHTILSSLNLGKWFLLSTGISLFKVTLFLISWIWHRYHITHKVLVSHLVSQALQTSIPTRPKAPRPNRFGRKHNSGELGTGAAGAGSKLQKGWLLWWEKWSWWWYILDFQHFYFCAWCLASTVFVDHRMNISFPTEVTQMR